MVRSDSDMVGVALMRNPNTVLLVIELFATDSDPAFKTKRPSLVPLLLMVAPLTEAAPLTFRRSRPAPVLPLKEFVPVRVTEVALLIWTPLLALPFAVRLLSTNA